MKRYEFERSVSLSKQAAKADGRCTRSPGERKNLVNVEHTLLHHKVNSEVEDEVTVEEHDTPYAQNITEVASFLMFLLKERECLSDAVRKAKQRMDIDFDGEVSLNAKRREVAEVFRNMCQIRSAERLCRSAGLGYKFNAEGNQISYRCDLKKVTIIDW